MSTARIQFGRSAPFAAIVRDARGRGVLTLAGVASQRREFRARREAGEVLQREVQELRTALAATERAAIGARAELDALKQEFADSKIAVATLRREISDLRTELGVSREAGRRLMAALQSDFVRPPIPARRADPIFVWLRSLLRRPASLAALN